MRKIALAMPILLLALAACGQAAPAASQPTAAGPPAATSAPPTEAPPATAPATTAPATPEPTTTTPATAIPPPTEAPTAIPSQPTTAPTPEQPPDKLVAAARQSLARRLSVRANSLTLKSATQQEWPDGALGCADPTKAYPQVITPGFLLFFGNGTKTFEVHTGGSEQQMILCENGQPTDLANQASAPATPVDAVQTTPVTQPMVELARQALAKELGIDVAAIKPTQVEEVEWSDSSLGCPKPGMNYLQVITPGYRIKLEAQGRSYEYHTDTGKRVVRCDKPAG